MVTCRDFRIVTVSPDFTVNETCPSRVTFAPFSMVRSVTFISALSGRMIGRLVRVWGQMGLMMIE